MRFEPIRMLRLEGAKGSRNDETRAEGIPGLPMTLIVNGESRTVAAATLAEALQALDYADATVATALNGEFVPARKREDVALKDGDRIEILAPRQGG
jgi:sulfur carrier protein